MSKVAVIGLVGESVFLRVPRHQAVGETAHADSIYRELGGKGYNQAVAAARYGAEVSFLCAAHADDVETITAAGRYDKVKVCVAAKDVPTAYGVIVTDNTGDNRVTVYRGAELSAEDVEPFFAEIASADALLINNEVPEQVNIAAAKIAKAAGKLVVLNPAPVRNVSDELLTYIDIFTPNEHEASALGDKEKLIVTLGERGCLVRWLDKTVPAFNIGTPVDTTGAGDTFSGVLAACLAEGVDVLSAVTVAQAASAIEVGRRYVMPAIPTRAEIDLFLEKNSAL